MGLIASNAYLAVFGAGTLVGAASAYFILKFKNNWHKPKVKVDLLGSHGKEEQYKYQDTDDEVRLIIGVRNDLKMQKGKVAAQCGHGAMAAYAKTLSTSPKLLKAWLQDGKSNGTKIAVRIDSEEQLLEIDKMAKDLNVLSCVIRDAGQTQVAPGTRTVIAIGPAPKSILEKITGNLKLY